MWNLISKFFGPLITIILAIALIQECSIKNRYKKIATSNPKQIEVASKIIEEYIDSAGNEHSIYKPTIVDYEQANNPKQEDLYKLIDSISKELKIAKKKNIKDISIVNNTYSSVTKGHHQDSVIKYADDITNWSLSLNDTTLRYNTNMKLSRVDYDDGKSILGFNVNAKNMYSDIWWDNKDIKIDNINRIIIKKLIPNNNIRVSSKSEYRINKNTMLSGASAEIQLNRLSFEYSFLRDFTNNSNENVLGFKYHIIK